MIVGAGVISRACQPATVCDSLFRYFAGKQRANEAVAKSFQSSGVLIKPTFIYGGDSFGLTPPRVSDGYGSGIDALLSAGPIRAIAGISPGPLKVLHYIALYHRLSKLCDKDTSKHTVFACPFTRLTEDELTMGNLDVTFVRLLATPCSLYIRAFFSHPRALIHRSPSY